MRAKEAQFYAFISGSGVKARTVLANYTIDPAQSNVTQEHSQLIKQGKFGFAVGRASTHNSRTLMLAELRALLSYVESADAPKAAYRDAIEIANCLGKRSVRTRKLTYKHLAELYGLDPALPVFRSLRFFWQRDPDRQPLLAAICAYSRDSLFRSTTSFVLNRPEGNAVPREAVEEFIEELEPGRFSKATLKSTAQNINSSWTQSGHLAGHVRKVRSRTVSSPAAVSLALLFGYISGLRGESMFKSDFTQILDCSYERLVDQAEDASRRGWISLKRVGQVVEVLFPSLITMQEMEWLREQN